MTVDVSQFLQTFYEESFEGLDIMESGLLNLEVGAADVDVVNGIFRAAHSIKGGSATFGLAEIASFTHVVETLLDEMRDGRREAAPDAVNLLLQSVDCLREMLAAHRDGEPADGQRVAALHEQLEVLLRRGVASGLKQEAAGGAPIPRAASPICGWHIVFRPYPHLFRTGNDPVRMFRELEGLGELRVQVDTDGLPAFADMDPEDSHLAWTLDLTGDVERALVEDVFAWVDGDCDLEISQKSGFESRESRLAALDSECVSGELLAKRRTDERRKGERRVSASTTGEAASIRVGIDKVDAVINLVGELVITQSMLSTLGEEFDMSMVHKLTDGLAQLERNTRELQEQVMRMRMLPIGFAFNRFPRLVHDMSQKLGKQIDLKLSGEQTELDKTVIENISDPLVHLVRNSLDHGIELPAERRAAGKPETGTLALNAYHKGGNIVIEVSDDGRGLNGDKILAKAKERGLVQADAQLTQEQIAELIFLPGFSTAEQVSDVSGRGVGMDVVRRNIQSLGGSVEIAYEPGNGSTFTIRLPLTLAILDGQTVAVGDEVYIVPLVSIIESMQVKPGMVNHVAGRGEVFSLRNEYLPVIRLYEVFGAKPRTTQLTGGLLVVVEGDGQRIGLFVDDLLGQQQVVIKSLEANYMKVEGLSGATILGDGSVALILDVPSLIRISNGAPAVHAYRKSA